MRRDDDWFGTLEIAHRTSGAWEDEEARRQFLAALTALEKVLDGTPSPRGFGAIAGLHGFRHRVARLSADERQWAERLGERLWSAMGTGRTYARRRCWGRWAYRPALTPSPSSVADIHEHRSPRAKYPRVVARTGKAPEQYPRYD